MHGAVTNGYHGATAQRMTGLPGRQTVRQTTHLPSRPLRDTQLDIVRGWLQLTIFVSHAAVPGISGWLIHGAWGLSDSAEQFVFLSGFVLGSLFARQWTKYGWTDATRDMLARAAKLYRTQLIVFALMGTMVIVADHSGLLPGQSSDWAGAIWRTIGTRSAGGPDDAVSANVDGHSARCSSGAWRCCLSLRRWKLLSARLIRYSGSPTCSVLMAASRGHQDAFRWRALVRSRNSRRRSLTRRVALPFLFRRRWPDGFSARLAASAALPR